MSAGHIVLASVQLVPRTMYVRDSHPAAPSHHAETCAPVSVFIIRSHLCFAAHGDLIAFAAERRDTQREASLFQSHPVRGTHFLRPSVTHLWHWLNFVDSSREVSVRQWDLWNTTIALRRLRDSSSCNCVDCCANLHTSSPTFSSRPTWNRSVFSRSRTRATTKSHNGP